MDEPIAGDGWVVTHLDRLGDGPGFRKIRPALARVAPSTVRLVRNVVDDDAVYVIVGGAAGEGYVGRDGRVPAPEERYRARS
jgi:hypothetical protein